MDKTQKLKKRVNAKLNQMKEAKTFVEMVRAWGNDIPDIPNDNLVFCPRNKLT
jgi:hypothetical protein